MVKQAVVSSTVIVTAAVVQGLLVPPVLVLVALVLLVPLLGFLARFLVVFSNVLLVPQKAKTN